MQREASRSAAAELPLLNAAARPPCGSFAAAFQSGDWRHRTPRPALRAGETIA